MKINRNQVPIKRLEWLMGVLCAELLYYNSTGFRQQIYIYYTYICMYIYMQLSCVKNVCFRKQSCRIKG